MKERERDREEYSKSRPLFSLNGRTNFKRVTDDDDQQRVFSTKKASKRREKVEFERKIRGGKQILGLKFIFTSY